MLARHFINIYSLSYAGGYLLGIWACFYCKGQFPPSFVTGLSNSRSRFYSVYSPWRHLIVFDSSFKIFCFIVTFLWTPLAKEWVSAPSPTFFPPASYDCRFLVLTEHWPAWTGNELMLGCYPFGSSVANEKMAPIPRVATALQVPSLVSRVRAGLHTYHPLTQVSQGRTYVHLHKGLGSDHHPHLSSI